MKMMAHVAPTWFVVVKQVLALLPLGALVRVLPGAAPPITLIHRGTPQPLELDYARLQEEVASRTLLAITDAEAALLHPAITDSEPPSSTR